MTPTPDTLRIATYNIHKGVQGLGLRRRLEIHNLGHAVEQLDADVVCLQEVRKVHRQEELYFSRWPDLPQADFLAPEGYEVVYRTNAHTRHGEHGNAVLSRWPVTSHRHEDMSDHHFEQRGLLHAEVLVGQRTVHVIVVHLGLIPSSRVRQVAQLQAYVEREVPATAPLAVAGDFNDWGSRIGRMLADADLHEWCGAHGAQEESTPDWRQPATAGQGRHWGRRISPSYLTFPSRLPLVQLDHVYVRGLKPLGQHVPRGAIWGRMSDHLPLIAEFGF